MISILVISVSLCSRFREGKLQDKGHSQYLIAKRQKKIGTEENNAPFFGRLFGSSFFFLVVVLYVWLLQRWRRINGRSLYRSGTARVLYHRRRRNRSRMTFCLGICLYWVRNLSLDDQTSFFSFFSLVSAYCCCCCWHLDSRVEDEKRKEKGKKKNAETDLLHLALREPSLMCTALVLPCCALFVQPSELISPLNDLTYSIQCPSHLFFIPFFKKKKKKKLKGQNNFR